MVEVKTIDGWDGSKKTKFGLDRYEVTDFDECAGAQANLPGYLLQDKRRVAAYARVSTCYEEQLDSYKTQKRYYKRMVSHCPNWELVGIYGDRGKSGTMIRKRKGFQRMMDDARAGKIDLIITKSVSRFSRNTVDALRAARELSQLGVAVCFEREALIICKENERENEGVLSIITSCAQKECWDASVNIKWGIKRRLENGKIMVPYQKLLGYALDENRKIKIVKKEARIVREIFHLYVYGDEKMNIQRIADYLTRKEKTTTGKKWSHNAVRRILTNEKYAGMMLAGKYYVEDYLTHKVKKNEGEESFLIAFDTHPQIISICDFLSAQAKLKESNIGCSYVYNRFLTLRKKDEKGCIIRNIVSSITKKGVT